MPDRTPAELCSSKRTNTASDSIRGSPAGRLQWLPKWADSFLLARARLASPRVLTPYPVRVQYSSAKSKPVVSSISRSVSVDDSPKLTKMANNRILSLSCPDKLGIIHAVTGIFAKNKLNTLDLQKFSDRISERFFMRVGRQRVPNS